MSKKITFLLVIAAAVLLSLPVQAQNAVKKAVPKSGQILNAQKKLTSKDFLKENSLEAALKKGEIDKEEFAKLWEKNLSDNESQPVAMSAPKKADNVDALPYSNALNTADLFNQFTVIDANSDNKTWAFSTYACYSYNSAAAADDWLISPGIKLEAGKNYNLSFNAYAGIVAYPEKLEVKIASANDIESISAGSSLIGETNINKGSADEMSLSKEGFSVTTTGYYYIGIHAISDADQYKLYVHDFLVEEGASASSPAAVDGFTVTPFEDGNVGATISFNAPTKSVGGDDITTVARIDVTRDGTVIKTFENVAAGSAQTFDDTEATVGNHTYQAISYGSDGTPGGKSEEITVMLSGVLTVPYTADFTTSGTFDAFTVLDANGDNRTWNWSSSYYAYCNYSSSSSTPNDDYLISSPIKLEAGKNYAVIANISAYSANYAERFEVVVGKEATAAGLSQTVIPATEVTSTEYADFEGSFTAAESGNYYVAIHCISDGNQYYLRVKTLTIEKGLEANAPAAPAIEVIPGAEGALSATVNVTAPSKDISGSDLGNNISKIELYRDGAIINTFEGVTAGQSLTFEDTEGLTNGTHKYQAIPYDAAGERGEKGEIVEKFIGTDIPALPEEMNAEDNATSILFSWDRVTEGENGGYVNPAAIDYKLWNLKIVSSLFGDYLDFDTEITTITDQQSYGYEFNTDEGNQTFKYFAVQTLNTAGTNSSARVSSLLVGAPYELPFAESFANKSLHYFWDSDAGLYVSTNASDGDGCALIIEPSDYVNYLATGKLNLNPAANPTLIFDAYQGSSTASLSIYGSVEGGTPTFIQNIALSDDYQNFKVPLTTVKSGRYSQVYFVTNNTSEADSVIIDNIKIGDLYSHNLAVDLSAPKTVQAGNKVTVTAKVENIGEETIDSYNITIKAGEKELLNEDVNEPLAMFESKKFDADFETTIFDEAGDVTITATVTPEVDLDETDNTSDAVITVTLPTAAPPTNLNVTESENGDITLTWDAPTGSTEEVTEGFETDLGDFVSIDSDGDGFGWDVHINTGTGNHSTHNGDGSAYSASYDNDSGTALTPDNWLVVPAILNGTFKFWAVGQDPSYAAEHFAVYVSTTSGTDVSTFTQVSEEFVATGEYQEYSVDLSSYAGQSGWVAIRHFNVTDMFVLVIDDVTYLVGGGDVAGYNIYVDGELETSLDADGNVNGMPGINKAASSLTAVLAGLGQSLTKDEHEFAVTAVYASGAESKPEKFLLTTTTSIESVSVDGKPVDIYSVDGKLIRKQATSLEGLKGLYIINNKKVIIQ